MLFSIQKKQYKFKYFKMSHNHEGGREWGKKEREINKMMIHALKSSIGVRFGFDNRFPVIVIVMQAM